MPHRRRHAGVGQCDVTRGRERRSRDLGHAPQQRYAQRCDTAAAIGAGNDSIAERNLNALEDALKAIEDFLAK